MSNKSGPLRSLVRRSYASIPGKAHFFKTLRRLTPLPEGLYRHLHFEGAFETTLPDASTMSLWHYGNTIENELFWSGFNGNWESTSLATWYWLSKGGDVIMDIGSNTGVYALAAKIAAGEQALVYSFEPIKRVFQKQERNIQLNDLDIRAYECAISSSVDQKEIFDPGHPHVYSASLEPAMLNESCPDRYLVDCMTIDQVVETDRLRHLDLLKIDTELHEMAVLEGAIQSILSYKPAIIVELLNSEIAEAAKRLLPDYHFYPIQEGRGIAPLAATDDATERNWLALSCEDVRNDVLVDGCTEESILSWSIN